MVTLFSLNVTCTQIIIFSLSCSCCENILHEVTLKLAGLLTGMETLLGVVLVLNII